MLHPELILLEALAVADRDIARADHATAEAHRERAQAVAAVEAAARSVEQAEDTARQLRDSLAALADKARLYEQRRAGALRALETGAGSADAAQRQLEQCEAILDETETAQLEALERQDSAAEAVRGAHELAAAERASLEATDAALPSRLSEASAARAEAEERRTAAREPLPAHTLSRYDALQARRGTAVAYIEDGACRACRRTAGKGQEQEILRGRLEACRSCGRWLVPSVQPDEPEPT
jgi:predicted  nucleic acid-binding Zn-ribbon protein